MQRVTGVSHLLHFPLLLLLLLVVPAPAQISHPPEEDHSKVMELQEVFAKSLCAPREQLVDVEQDHSGEVKQNHSGEVKQNHSGEVKQNHSGEVKQNHSGEVKQNHSGEVKQNHSGEVKHIYLPACVRLQRCAGCCNDESLQCQPALERNVSMQVMRIHPMSKIDYVELTFVEHQSCECRVRQKPLKNKSESMKNRGRRRKHKKTAGGCSKC